MQRVILWFPTIQLLWSFAQTLTAHAIEINISNRTLICQCTEEYIANAITDFKARVIEISKKMDACP